LGDLGVEGRIILKWSLRKGRGEGVGCGRLPKDRAKR